MEYFKKHWKVVLAVLVVVIVSLYAIWELPYSLRVRDKKGYRKNNDAPASVMIDIYFKHHEMINAKRAAVIQVVGGFLFIVGMYIAYRRAKAMEDNAKAMEENARAAHENARAAHENARTASDQVYEQRRQNEEQRKSDRETLTLEQYTKAIDQLGNNDSIAVRLGAIYSLEQIMNSANIQDIKYHDQIIELLAAFVRDERKVEKVVDEEGESITVKDREEVIIESYIPIMTDIRAILTVLGRRKNRDNEKVEIDLKNTNWIDADLSHMKLEGFNLRRAHLENANLWNAHLENADLLNAHLENVGLMDTHLENAKLWNAKLEDADLRGANLTGIKTSFPDNNKVTKKWDIYNDTDETRTAFIKKLEKAEFVRDIQLDDEIVKIIEEEFPALYKRINKYNHPSK